MNQSYRYLVVGGGLAGASACEGIREVDAQGSILMLAEESVLPYQRPPLSKKLWNGQKKIEEIFIHDASFYQKNGIDLKLTTHVTDIDPQEREASTAGEERYRYDKLLLATGGVPRNLHLPGLADEEIMTFRTLEDYRVLRSRLTPQSRIVIVGGGFIGLEMAAALSLNRFAVTLIFPEPYPLHRLFPMPLGQRIVALYESRGVEVLAGDAPLQGERQGDRIRLETRKGRRLECSVLLAGIGLQPETALARSAGIAIENGIPVDAFLQTSIPGIYAAGDNAFFPCPALGKRLRLEHWANAQAQGRQAGRNMAGHPQPYDALPYFFSDLFEFRFDAVGEVDISLATFADWQKENETGVVYYLRDDKVRGVLLCNFMNRVPAARELMRHQEPVSKNALAGAIR